MAHSSEPGKIITFYSYKGGTGRSMTLANVAWILASKGKRVLVLDWDLEAPGLHRYFSPFLNDKDLTTSNGIIDFIVAFAVEAMEHTKEKTATEGAKEREWFKPYANILRYASSLRWDFPDNGALDFVPAGRQGTAYSTRVNSFNWQSFYELLGGGEFLEAVKEKMRAEYDYILIDSRTGVSDTSGICTVQMPDLLVVCFTLNNQSIEGAAGVASSVYDQRRKEGGLRIFPVPTRTDVAELEKLESRRDYAKDMFDRVLDHLPKTERKSYWGNVEIPYVPFYAYEETLATFRDRPENQSSSILAPIERLTAHLTDGKVTNLNPPDEKQRDEVLTKFINETLLNYDLFISHAPADAKWAEMLAQHLSREKVKGRKLRLFLPEADAQPGDDIAKRVQSAISRSGKIILLVSPEWVGSLEDEKSIVAQLAAEDREKRLIPLYLRECEIPAPLRPLRFVDFRNQSNFTDGYEKLLTIVREQQAAAEFLPTFESAISAPSFATPPVIGFVTRRDREGRDLVERLREELGGKDKRPIVLWGVGGVGKTTLAVELARSLNGVANQRVVWIGAEDHAKLAFYTLLDEVLLQFDHADLRRLALTEKEEQVRALASAAPTVIVLDDFEMLSSFGQSRIEAFFVKNPPCPILITGRQRISSALNILVTGLSQEETNEFIDRWIKVKGYESNVYDELRARIFKNTEGLPLTLRLLLGHLDLDKDFETTFEQMAQTTGSSVERIFRLLYDSPSLSDKDREAFLALSFFVPSASREALAEVADFGEDAKPLNETLQRLSALGLVRERGTTGRLYVEGLMRELAQAILSKDERREKLQKGFIEYFLIYAEAYASRDDFDALEAERNNLFAAIDLSVELGFWRGVISMGLSIAIRGRWLIEKGDLDEALYRCKQALAAAKAAEKGNLLTVFAQEAASISVSRGQVEEASEIYQQALASLMELKDTEGQALILHDMGNILSSGGMFAEARKMYELSLALGQSTDDKSERQMDKKVSTANLLRLSEIAYQERNLEDEERYLQQALELASEGEQTPESTREVAFYLRNLGNVALRSGMLEEAHAYAEKSLALTGKLGDQQGIATSLYQLGMVASSQQDLDKAHELFARSLEIEKKIGNIADTAAILHQLGNLSYKRQEWDEARRLYDESLEIREKIGDQLGISHILYNLALMAQDRGELTEAKQLYNESFEIVRKLGDMNDAARILHQLGGLAETEGNREEAVRLFGEALSIYESLKSPFVEAARRDLERIQAPTS